MFRLWNIIGRNHVVKIFTCEKCSKEFLLKTSCKFSLHTLYINQIQLNILSIIKIMFTPLKL